MSELDDHDLLSQYAQKNSEAAFAALAERHIGLVYSVALRSVGNAHAAEEISQAVFIILANKADKLSRKVALSGWLYQTTRLTSANFLRGEIRRQKREQEAFMQSLSNDTETWTHIAPLLDNALDKLNGRDRDAIVLRFFENKNLREVGLVMGASEDAAKMRVNRALEKLRKFFGKRGATFSAAAIAGAVSANSVHAAPVGLAKTISVAALAKGAAASGSTLALAKGTLKIMAWTKTQTVILVGIGILLAAGTTTITVKEIQEHKKYSWEVPEANFEAFYDAPAQVRIVPTKFSKSGDWCSDGDRGAMGIAQLLSSIIQVAYQKSELYMVSETDLPTNRYDFLAKLVDARVPHQNMPTDTNWAVELQKVIAEKFELTGKLEMRDTDVLVLRPIRTGIRNFKISHSMPNGMAIMRGHGIYSFYEQPIETLLSPLEQHFQIPIIDQTGLTNHYDFKLYWDEPDYKQPNLDGLKQALRDQLGLELVPKNMPVEMLVIKKSN